MQVDAHITPKKQPLYRSLYIQVITAIVIGVILGHFYPESGAAMKPLGDGFIKLIKMIIAPIIFCTVVIGIAGMEDMKKVGKTGGLALLYFEVVSTLALLVGLVIVNVLHPGVGMNVDVSTLDTKSIAAYTGPGKIGTVTEYLMHIIPNSMIDAFAQGDILQILLISVLFGFALHKFGGRGTLVFDMIEKGSHVLFGIVGMIMRLAPIGAFGAMAYTIGKFGTGAILNLIGLILTFYATSLIFIVVVLGAIAWYVGFNIFRYIAYIKDELLIVLGTSSSESALPQLMEKLERLGCSKSVVGLVVPTGYSFNLDGTNIYMTLATLFIAQALGVQVTFQQELVILGVAMLTSKGASGVTGAGFITLAATLAVVDPRLVPGMAIVLGIDKFMSECRALTNLTGNGVAAIVVSWWENELDRDKLNAGLKRQVDVASVSEAVTTD